MVTEANKPEWYLVFIIYASEHIRTPNDDVLAQECVYLIKSSNAENAFEESLKWASPRQIVPIENSEVIELPLLGVTEVMPIWEPLEHGSELGYRDGSFKSWEELTKSILHLEDIRKKGLLPQLSDKIPQPSPIDVP
jgi:hypothetical protein